MLTFLLPLISSHDSELIVFESHSFGGFYRFLGPLTAVALTLLILTSPPIVNAYSRSKEKHLSQLF